MRLGKKFVILQVLVLFLIGTSAAQAVEQSTFTDDPGVNMIVDLLVVRPVSIVGAGAGCVFFVASLPFTVWTKERIKKAGDALVKTPGTYAFVRPLGEF